MNEDSDPAMPRKKWTIYIKFKIDVGLGPTSWCAEPFESFDNETDFNMARKAIEAKLRNKEDFLNEHSLIRMHYADILQVWWERTDKTEIFNKEYERD